MITDKKELARIFKLSEPTAIGFSGGRTSALMLRLTLDANGGALPAHAYVCFQNTGKERLETLDFIDEVSRRWRVPVRWMEFDAVYGKTPKGKVRYREVTYKTASRDGEPFEKMLDFYKAFRRAEKGLDPILPNATQRICTAYLKVRLQRQFMIAQGISRWVSMVGMRADEPRRVATIKMANEKRDDPRVYGITPLASAGITTQDVLAYWNESPFNLAIPSVRGNCDLCFLKSKGKLLSTMQENPELAKWWIAQERRLGTTFKKGTTYMKLLKDSKQYVPKPGDEADQLDDCACTD